jgi:hypothetical protein
MTKDRIREWLAAQRHSRQWLAEKCGVVPKTVNNWLSSDRTIPPKAVRIIESLIEADRVKEFEGNAQARLVLEFTPEEFEEICEAALKEQMTVQNWAVSKLRAMMLGRLSLG